MNNYSRFHITFLRGIANFVGKLGSSLRSSQLCGELDNQIVNFDLKFPTSAALNFTRLLTCVKSVMNLADKTLHSCRLCSLQ